MLTTKWVEIYFILINFFISEKYKKRTKEKMERIYWPLLWIILFAGIIYVNSSVPQQQQPSSPLKGKNRKRVKKN